MQPALQHVCTANLPADRPAHDRCISSPRQPSPAVLVAHLMAVGWNQILEGQHCGNPPQNATLSQTQRTTANPACWDCCDQQPTQLSSPTGMFCASAAASMRQGGSWSHLQPAHAAVLQQCSSPSTTSGWHSSNKKGELWVAGTCGKPVPCHACRTVPCVLCCAVVVLCCAVSQAAPAHYGT